MLCPVCKNTQLVMTERKNIEIDYCPDCRGVWLDRGELDKIVEKSTEELISSQKTSHSDRAGKDDSKHDTRKDHNRDHYYDNKHYDSDYARQHKRKSFWTELFD